MKRIALFLLLAFCGVTLAQLDNVGFVGRLNPVTASACSTTDTAIPHDDFLEGFQSASTESTWTRTANGTTANIDSNADNSTASTGKPDASCDRSFKLTVPSDGTETFLTYTRGSAIDLTSQGVDIVFYFRMDNLPATGKYFYPLTVRSATVRIGRVHVYNNGGSIYCRFETTGRTSSAYYTAAFSAGAWNKITIHLDPTAANCTFQLNAEVAKSFTRYDNASYNTFSVMQVGATDALLAGDADGAVVWWDVICINTP